MRTVFVTRSRLGLACLRELVSQGADVGAVFTKPESEDISDRVDLDAFSRSNDVPLHRVESATADRTVDRIASYDPEILFVVGWSELIDRRLIDVPSVTALGMHPSPLPRGRGRAPIAWTLIKGLEETALSFFHLVEEADAGDLVGQRPVPVDRLDDANSLYGKICEAARDLVAETYPELSAGEVPRIIQDEGEATWWPTRRPSHGVIDWHRPAERLYNWIRGQTHPYPGAYSILDGRRVTIWEANPPEKEHTLVSPGKIVERRGNGLAVAAWESVIELRTIQVENGDEEPAAKLITEHGYEPGDRFVDVRDLVSSPDRQ